MTQVLISGLIDAGFNVNGERVYLKGDRKVVIRGGAVVVLADLDRSNEKRFKRLPRRRVRTDWVPVVVERTDGQFHREKAVAAAEAARAKALENPEASGYGKKTNVGAGTTKGPGGQKPTKGSNAERAAKRARKAAQVKHRGRGKKR